MRRPRPLPLVALGCSLLLAACAAPPPAAVAPAPQAPPPEPKAVVVLLPGADGSVGRVIVSTEGGSRTLDAPGSATKVVDARTSPSEPAPMAPAEIEAAFGAALGALPEPPLRFLLYFEKGSTELTPDSRREFPAVVQAIRGRASADTSVVGHSDTAGDAQANLGLSLRRAMAVAALLAAEGVAPEALEITSHGEANLLVPTGDDIAESRNRRVEVTVR